MTAYRYLVLAGVAFILGGTSYALRPLEPSGPRYEVTALRSHIATLEAALYRAEGERCENLGVHPVPPPTKRGRK